MPRKKTEKQDVPATPDKQDVPATPDKPDKPDGAPSIAGGALPAFTMPDGEEKKKRKRRTVKPKVEPLVDFQLPMAALMITATDALAGYLKTRGVDAKRADCWRASDKEAEQFQDAFNYWCTVRAPQLEKYYPEIAMGIALGNYALRAATGISPDIADAPDPDAK